MANATSRRRRPRRTAPMQGTSIVSFSKTDKPTAPRKLVRSATSKVTKAGANTKKGRRGKQSEATKAKKRKEAAAKARGKKAGVGNSTSGVRAPAKAPKPEKVYNDELDNEGLEYEVEALRDSKTEDGKRFYLVSWVGWAETANTWEPEVHLRNATEKIAEFGQEFPDKA